MCPGRSATSRQTRLPGATILAEEDGWNDRGSFQLRCVMERYAEIHAVAYRSIFRLDREPREAERGYRRRDRQRPDVI